MPVSRWVFSAAIVLMAALIGTATPAQAQGRLKPKHYVVASTRAVSVTRTVLVRRGYRVVRVDRVGPTRVVYYRHGRGPVRRMVIRSLNDRVFFEDAEPNVLVDIDIELNR
jgi:hypothetical protein